VPPSAYDPRPVRSGGARRALRSPLGWLTRLHPLRSWLVVMAVIVGLSAIGLRSLAFLVAIGWTGYAVYTWLAPSIRRRLRR